MAGLYAHIPFCRSRCIYCGFYSTVALELRQRYVDAVCRELELRRHYLHEPVHTIYIGGGTPSQLALPQLRQLMEALPRSEAQEITIEANPDDVTEEFAAAMATLAINRVSMGAQTFSDERLRFLRRRHTASQVVQAVERLRAAGISNISIDLIYGFPGETLDDWQQDISQALALGVEHLSAYSLTFEEGTPLYWMLQQGSVREADEELSLQMYDVLIDRLTGAGYEHYEISNFGKIRSRHNSSYWTGVPYLGLGAAAHSYDGQSRQWNVSDVRQYIESVERGTVPFEREVLTEQEQYNDCVMTALRTCEGLDLNALTDQQRAYCMAQARRFIDNGLLRQVSHHLVLTRQGLPVSNMIMSELMDVGP